MALEFRAIRPSDKAALNESFGRLSKESRRKRFFAPKMLLTEKELQYFTECDGVNHYAIVASHYDGTSSSPSGVGVARYVRLKDQPEVAELAIVVVDSWQQKGVGKRLLKRIVAAAAENKIKKILAISQADNEELQGLLRDYSNHLDIVYEQGELRIGFDIDPKEDMAALLPALRAALKLAAQGAVMVPLRLGQRTWRQLASSRDKQETGSD